MEIIDWKKKYNEALEKIKRYATDKYGCTRLKPADIFPELFNDEERIKKAIIDALNSHNNSINVLSSRGYSMDDVISYLEKQKAVNEKESFAWTRHDEAVRKEAIACLENWKGAIIRVGGLVDYENILAWLKEELPEKQKERQEVNCDFYNKELSDIVSAELYKYSGSNSIKSPWALDSTGIQYPLYFANLGAKWQKKQKSREWNGEDERIRNEILEYFTITRARDFVANPERRKWISYIEKQKESIKEVEPITDGLNTEFQKQVSYLIASSINKEHEYSEGYVKWISQSLLEYAKKESVKGSDEGERMRKAISCLVKNMPDNYGFAFGIGKSDMLAYLEKQKESGIRWYKSDNRDNPKKPYIDKAGIFYTTDGRMCYASEIEKRKEQKPVEKQNYSGLTDLERAIHRGFLVAGVENVPRTIIEETAKDCLAQMKPAEWSEEDERMLSRCIKSVESSKNFAESQTFKEAKDKEKDWLKSLPERFNLQPKQEWSEEDEYRFKLLMAMCEDSQNKSLTISTTYREMQETEDWLKNRFKSICPQPKQEWSEEDKEILRTFKFICKKLIENPSGEKFSVDPPYAEKMLKFLESLYPDSKHEPICSWKPSKEQMGFLNGLLTTYMTVGQKQALKSLIGDLKKL